MKYTGAINILSTQGDILLTNPIMEVVGIFDTVDDLNPEDTFKYIRCVFLGDENSTPHSRFWKVETDDTQAEVNANPILSQFK